MIGMGSPVSSLVSITPKGPTPPPGQATSVNKGEEAVRARKAKNGSGPDPTRDAVRKELDQKLKPKLEKALAGNPQALKQVRPLLQTIERGIIDTVTTLSRTAAAKVPLSDSELRKVDRDMAMGLVAAIDQHGVVGLAAVAVEVAKMQSTAVRPAPSQRVGQPRTYSGTDVVPDVSGSRTLGQLTLFDTNGIGKRSLVPLWTAWRRGQEEGSNPADRDRASWREIGRVVFPVASRPQVLLNLERKWFEGKTDFLAGTSEAKRNTLELRATVPLVNIPIFDAGRGVRVTSSESRLLGTDRVADGIFSVAREHPLLSVIGGAAVTGILVYGLSRARPLPEIQEAVAMTFIGLAGAFTADSSTLQSARGTVGITGDFRFGFKSERSNPEGFAQLQIEPAIEAQLLSVISGYNRFPLTNAPLDLSTVPLFVKASGKGAGGSRTSKGFFTEGSVALAMGTKANVSTIPLGTPKAGPTQFSIDPFNGTTLDLNKPADKKRWDTMFEFLQPAARVMAQRGSNRKAGAVTVVMTVGRTYLNLGNKSEFYRATAPDGRGGDAFSGMSYGARLDSTKVAELERRTRERPWHEQIFDKSPGFVKALIDNRTPGQRAISRPVERAGVAQQLKPVEVVAAELNWMAVQHPDRFGQASFVTAERLIAANRSRVSWVDIAQSDGSTRSVAAFREGENIDTTLVAARKGGVMLAASVATESGPVDLPPGRQRSTHVQKVPVLGGASSASLQQQALDAAQTRRPGPVGALGAFHFHKYLGIEPLGLQVKLGTTANGYNAVQTSSGTYRIPAQHATTEEDIKGWAMRSIQREDIKGAYALPRRTGGGASASLQQRAFDAAQTRRPGPLGALGAFHFQKYLGISPLGVQVKLGFTANGYGAVQTSSGTYGIPAAYATHDGEIRDWVMRSIVRGDIKGAYAL